jgi:hypothetical protein
MLERSRTPSRLPAEALATFALGCVPIVALGFADGGFFPRPWGWAALGLAAAAVVVALVHPDLGVSPRALVLLGILASLGGWIAASLMWTQSFGLTVEGLQRLLVYVAGVGTAVLLVRARNRGALVFGVFTGTCVVVVSGLVSYLLSREQTTDVFQGSYLHRPLGYANATGIVAVIAILLGLGIAIDAASRAVRVVAAIALVPLACALALTGSRAAWGAFVLGGGIALAMSESRARTAGSWARVLLVPGAAAALALASQATDSAIVGDRADRLGERLLLELVVLTGIAAVPALLVARQRVTASRAMGRPRWMPIAVVAVLLIGAAAAGPSLASDRLAFWTVAADEFGRHPLLGSGAETYGQVWLERRATVESVRDAHSVLLESMSELGVVGLALVVALLAAPLVWGLRSRRHPLVPAATGACAAYAVHASVDWDWEMPAVTMAALFCAVSLAATADGATRGRTLGARSRSAAVGLACLAAAAAFTGLVGASAMEEATRALARGNAAAAERAAGRAERWQPWSAEPLLIRGQAMVSLGRSAEARALFARAARRESHDYRAWLALAAVSDAATARDAVLRAWALNPLAVRIATSTTKGGTA